MSEKDITIIDYLEDPGRFADILNVSVYSGRQIILPEHIKKDNRSDAILSENNKEKSIEIYRDIVREVQTRMYSVIIPVEAQDKVHHAMPLRVMTGNAARYHAQYRKIKNDHIRKKDLVDKSEFLSKYARSDKLTPVSTIVLYLGTNPWDGPRCLKDMMDLDNMPLEMQEFIPDYPLYIIEARHFPDSELFRTDLKYVFGFLQRDTDKDALKEYISENEKAFSNMASDAFRVITKYSNSKNIIKDDHSISKGGTKNMCKALEDMREESRQIGISQGINQGISQGIIKGSIQTYLEFGLTMELIAEKIIQKYSLSKEEAERYITDSCPV